MRHHPNLKFFWFEDMRKDLGRVIKETCQFLQVTTILSLLNWISHTFLENNS